MNRQPKVSIIIPLYVIEERFFQDLLKFQDLNYKNFEILIVCDKKVNLPKLRGIEVRLILTKRKNTGPAEKRDIALKKTRGKICAFIDDDAYPHPDWLKNAVSKFEKTNVVAVGGPGITPKEDDYWEQLTGLVYSSFFCGGSARYRFVKEKQRYVSDFPAYNLFVKTNILKEVGGYGNHFYGGEDTFLCLKLIKANHTILYSPEVVVYHHRRPLFVPYLKQIANIGKHRGYFARVFPETSRLIGYFVPSVLALGFFGLLLASLFIPYLRFVFLFLFFSFYLLGWFSIIGKSSTINTLIATFGIITTHLIYGLSFVKGFFTKNLSR